MPPSPTIQLAQALIRRESITPEDAGCQQLILARLEKLGFIGEWINREGVTNLWTTRNPSKPKTPKPLLVFAGHTDVVPPGALDQWSNPPFAATIKDGMLHGRGAADMKGSIAAFITACERFIAHHPAHQGNLGLLITSDEEGAGEYGTREVMRVLKSRKQKIDMCLVGEPSSDQTLGDTIKIGRRGSISARVRIIGTQGHIAYPPPPPLSNPIHRAARAVAALLAIKWDAGNENFPPTSFQLANFNAGTGVSNVIPAQAEFQFNLRYSPQTTEREIRTRVETTLAQTEPQPPSTAQPTYQIHWKPSGVPFETKSGKLLNAVSASIQSITGRQPNRSTSGGTSDGRFIAPSGAEVVELGPRNATIHQIDECVSTADLDQLSAIYEQILQRLLT